jgi:hypothetical protein
VRISQRDKGKGVWHPDHSYGNNSLVWIPYSLVL